MHMRYLQALANIEDHLESVQEALEILEKSPNATDIRTNITKDKLTRWGSITLTDKQHIEEELSVVRYLIGCRITFTHDKDEFKPTQDVVARCFNRHLYFLEHAHNCHQYNVNKHRSKLVQKQYKACRHYLFKFSCPAWVDRLPKEIKVF